MMNKKLWVEQLKHFGFSESEVQRLLLGGIVYKDEFDTSWGYTLFNALYFYETSEMGLYSQHKGAGEGCFWTDWEREFTLGSENRVSLARFSGRRR